MCSKALFTLRENFGFLKTSENVAEVLPGVREKALVNTLKGGLSHHKQNHHGYRWCHLTLHPIWSPYIAQPYLLVAWLIVWWWVLKKKWSTQGSTLGTGDLSLVTWSPAHRGRFVSCENITSNPQTNLVLREDSNRFANLKPNSDWTVSCCLCFNLLHLVFDSSSQS